MSNTHKAFGSMKVDQQGNTIKNALTQVTAIEKWLGVCLNSNSLDKIEIKKLFSSISEKLIIKIKENEVNIVSWICSFESFNMEILFKIEDFFINIELSCKEFSICSFLQEWIYLFYRLKEYIDHDGISIPSFDYTNFDKSGIR